MNSDFTSAVGVNVYLKGDIIRSGNSGILDKELISLAGVVGLEIKQVFTQFRESYTPALFIGEGKLSEIGEFMRSGNIDTIIFSAPLKAGVKSNIENFLEKILDYPARLLDRNELIMAIFAHHAKTSEAKIQVELAQLEYLLPRLLGKGTALSRLGAGIGTRGPGETQLEIDRRKIQKRISFLKKKLQSIEKRRKLSRERRHSEFMISLVGYTNSGKSTLINNITKGGAYVEDQVFATLSPVIRRLYLNSEKQVLISDTVGFIRNLPPELIESFKSTLEEIRFSDVIIFLIDISMPDWRERLDVTKSIVGDLLEGTKSMIYVFNKIDLVDSERIDLIRSELSEAVFISALENTGISDLKSRLLKMIDEI